ncbi:hypothetical protein COO60DRAFT_1511173, partial [Scenedesmus sp. NREL 46B-D3]
TNTRRPSGQRQSGHNAWGEDTASRPLARLHTGWRSRGTPTAHATDGHQTAVGSRMGHGPPAPCCVAAAVHGGYNTNAADTQQASLPPKPDVVMLPSGMFTLTRKTGHLLISISAMASRNFRPKPWLRLPLPLLLLPPLPAATLLLLLLLPPGAGTDAPDHLLLLLLLLLRPSSPPAAAAAAAAALPPLACSSEPASEAVGLEQPRPLAWELE